MDKSLAERRPTLDDLQDPVSKRKILGELYEEEVKVGKVSCFPKDVDPRLYNFKA